VYLFYIIYKQPRCPTTDEWVKEMWYTHTMEFNSAIRKNYPMWFEGKWIELEDIMLSEVIQFLKIKSTCFSMWKIDPKDKHTHKTKHDRIQTHL
jgi:hypothetical protein